MKIFVLASLLLAHLVAAAATQTFDVHPGVRVTMDLPSQWRAQSPTPSKLGGLNVYFEGPNEGVCLPAIVGQVLYRASGMMDSNEKLKEEFIHSCRGIAAASVEKQIDPQTLVLKSGIGFYCSFTDEALVGKAKGDRDAQVATRYSIVLSDSVIVLITVYTDNKDGAAWKNAKAALESLVIVPLDSGSK